MTGETAEKTEPWCEQNGVKYPYAYDSTNQLFSKLGCRGYPSAVLVDPKGIVAWKGHPASLNASIIKKHIGGANRAPVGAMGIANSWPDSAKSIKKLLAKQQLGKAIVAANKLAANDPSCRVVVDSLVKLADRKVTDVKALEEKGDFLGVIKAAKAAKKSLTGLPQGGEIAAIAKAVAADSNSSKIIRAQKAVAKIKASFSKIKKSRDAESRIKRLRKILVKNGGNFAGATAEKLIADLENRSFRR